jgi:hypothetical protein
MGQNFIYNPKLFLFIDRITELVKLHAEKYVLLDVKPIPEFSKLFSVIVKLNFTNEGDDQDIVEGAAETFYHNDDLHSALMLYIGTRQYLTFQTEINDIKLRIKELERTFRNLGGMTPYFNRNDFIYFIRRYLGVKASKDMYTILNILGLYHAEIHIPKINRGLAQMGIMRWTYDQITQNLINKLVSERTGFTQNVVQITLVKHIEEWWEEPNDAELDFYMTEVEFNDPIGLNNEDVV